MSNTPNVYLSPEDLGTLRTASYYLPESHASAQNLKALIKRIEPAIIPTSALWQAQLYNYPDSVQLTPREVLDWVYKDKAGRYPQIALTIQYPSGVFYIIPAGISHPEYRGYRYGTAGNEYLSFN